MSSELVLTGCNSGSLGGYLKALGVIRVVSGFEPATRAWWSGRGFHLSGITRVRLDEILLFHYSPTPVTHPWNGGSGYYEKDKSPKAVLNAIAQTSSPRFADIRDTIAIGRQVVQSMGGEKPNEVGKKMMVERLRAEWPDRALEWLDAAIAIGDERLVMAPMLGSGGNDARLEFSSLFLQRLGILWDLPTALPTEAAPALLAQSLFGEPAPWMTNDSIGQFDPAGAGGQNSSSSESEASPVNNAFDVVLAFEGCCVFAARPSRRLTRDSTEGISSPFTVPGGSAGVGSGATVSRDALSGSGAMTRAEIWLPVWEKPSTHQAIRSLFIDGRTTVGNRSARNGLDMARAVGTLGVSRGIGAFERLALLRRKGDTHVAVNLGRFVVHENPGAGLLGDLDRRNWLSRITALANDGKSPERLRRQVSALLGAVMEMASDGSPARVQDVLISFGDLLGYLLRSGAVPLPNLVPGYLSEGWLQRADDHSHEFRIAAAISSLRGMPPRCILYKIDMNGNLIPRKTSPDVIWNEGNLVSSLLGMAHRRRLREKDRKSDGEKDRKNDPRFDGYAPADLAALSAFAAGRVDDSRISSLVAGLCWLNRSRILEARKVNGLPISHTVALLKPFFISDASLLENGIMPPGNRLSAPPDILRRISTGSIDSVVRTALPRLRAAGIKVEHADSHCTVPDPARLAATLLIPITNPTIKSLARMIAGLPDESRRKSN